jgi:hypothetical protein
MIEKKRTLPKKLARAGGWALLRRFGKSVPYFGSVIAIGFVGSDIKRKGLVKGVLNSGVDAIPFVGFAKNAIELATGDFFPDKRVKKEQK